MQVLLAFAIVVLLFVIKVLKTYNDPVWKNIPGPSYKLPFFGLAFELVNYGGVSTYQTKWSKQYGPVCRYYIWGFTTVLVTDPALVKHVLLNNRLFDKDILDYHFLSDIIGKGLITEWDESKHKYHRSIVGPAFSHHHVRGLAPIFQNKAAILVEDWLKQADTGVPVSIKEGIAKASSDAIGEAAFGYKLNSQRTDSPNSIYHIFAAILGHSYSNVLQVLPVVKNLIPSYHRKMATISLLDQQVNKMVNEKIEKRNNKETVRDGEKEQRDLLDIMMDCKNEDGAMLTKAELSDETKTVLLAGYETTSTCVMWTCFLLAKYPEIQQRVADEVLRVIGRDKIPTAEDIDEMPYLYKVLRESLRYYPPVPLFVRRATEDTELGGFKITKGTRIHINIHHQHHNSPIWDKPELFNPDRWGNDESEGNLLGSYMPFIMGARNCVGSKFAQLEVRVIVAMIIQKLKLAQVPGRADPEPLARISTFPSTPILVLFSHRK